MNNNEIFIVQIAEHPDYYNVCYVTTGRDSVGEFILSKIPNLAKFDKIKLCQLIERRRDRVSVAGNDANGHYLTISAELTLPLPRP